jgi:hypothetical protein
MTKKLKYLLGFIAMCVLSPFCYGSPTIQNVTLNGLNIDSHYSSFADPGTGVVFSNGITNGGSGFIVDFFNATPSLPDITPGRILSAQGYVGNGGASAPANFGFTMTLPTPSYGVSMIMDYASTFSGPAASVLLQGFDANNILVASDNVTPPMGFFQEQPLSLSSATGNIVTVTLTPTNIFDNLAAITYTSALPEPAALSFLATGCFFLSRRSRHSSL